MKSWKDHINEQVDLAIDHLKAYKINSNTECLKQARKAIKAAIALEEAL